MKLYHVDYPGVSCQHIVASGHAEVITTMLAWLTHNNHPRTNGIKITEVDPMNLDRKGRMELAELLRTNISSIASYDHEAGWTLHTVFDAPYP
jgi:hypothetical protein